MNASIILSKCTCSCGFKQESSQVLEMQQRWVTHMKEIETKKNELVYQGSKSHGLIYHNHLAHIWITHANKSTKKSNGLTLLSIKSTVKTGYIHKNLQKEFYIIGEVIKRYSSSCNII